MYAYFFLTKTLSSYYIYFQVVEIAKLLLDQGHFFSEKKKTKKPKPKMVSSELYCWNCWRNLSSLLLSFEK
jgi:hypothetical protein